MPRAGALLHDFLPAGGDLRRRRRGPPRLRRARRLPAQAAQPAQVPDQEPRAGSAGSRSTGPPWPPCAASRDGRSPSIPTTRRSKRPRQWIAAPGAGAGGARGARRDRRAARSRHSSGADRGRPGRVRPLAAHQRAPAEAGRLRRRRRHDPARRRHGRAAPHLRGSRVGVQRRHAARDDGSECACSAGCRRRASRSSTARWRRRASASPDAGTIADVVSCPGAESCRLAVTQSRGLGRLLGDHLRAQADIADAVGAADIKISGCPNGCGLHHVAAIGFQGSIRKLGARAVPQYFVMAGGGADDEGRGVRTHRREDSRAAVPRGGRPPGRPLPRGAAAPTRASRRSCAARTSPAQGARCRISRRSRKRPPTRRTSSIWRKTRRSRRKSSTESAAREAQSY